MEDQEKAITKAPYGNFPCVHYIIEEHIWGENTHWFGSLYGIPLEFWRKESILNIAGEIGDVICLDQGMEGRKRIDYARLVLRMRKPFERESRLLVCSGQLNISIHLMVEESDAEVEFLNWGEDGTNEVEQSEEVSLNRWHADKDSRLTKSIQWENNTGRRNYNSTTWLYSEVCRNGSTSGESSGLISLQPEPAVRQNLALAIKPQPSYSPQSTPKASQLPHLSPTPNHQLSPTSVNAPKLTPLPTIHRPNLLPSPLYSPEVGDSSTPLSKASHISSSLLASSPPTADPHIITYQRKTSSSPEIMPTLQSPFSTTSMSRREGKEVGSPMEKEKGTVTSNNSRKSPGLPPAQGVPDYLSLGGPLGGIYNKGKSISTPFMARRKNTTDSWVELLEEQRDKYSEEEMMQMREWALKIDEFAAKSKTQGVEEDKNSTP